MKRILLAPDSFKSMLTAREVCEIKTRVIRSIFPDALVTSAPMTDDGAF